MALFRYRRRPGQRIAGEPRKDHPTAHRCLGGGLRKGKGRLPGFPVAGQRQQTHLCTGSQKGSLAPAGGQGAGAEVRPKRERSLYHPFQRHCAFFLGPAEGQPHAHL